MVWAPSYPSASCNLLKVVGNMILQKYFDNKSMCQPKYYGVYQWSNYINKTKTCISG